MSLQPTFWAAVFLGAAALARLERLSAIFADMALRVFGGAAICFLGFAAKQTRFESPVVLPNRGAFYYWIWRRLPEVRGVLVITFATQRGRIFPHLRVSCRGIKADRSSDVSTSCGGVAHRKSGGLQNRVRAGSIPASPA